MPFPQEGEFLTLMGLRAWALHTVHVRRSTIFLVVFAFLWNTGLVWPPKPLCLRS